ncbi:MAG: ComEA family DNA-binding protein [Bacteroidota bacterium]
MKAWWRIPRGEAMGFLGLSLLTVTLPWVRCWMTTEQVPTQSSDPALIASIHDLRNRSFRARSEHWVGDSGRIQKLQSGQRIDLNHADTLALRRLRGVGAATARRIADYRRRLGGFIRTDQLLEVYGMDTLTFEVVLKYVTLDTSKVIPLDINTTDLEALADHPYVGWALAKKILAYRRQHGPYTSGSDMLRQLDVDSIARRRLLPYCTR